MAWGNRKLVPFILFTSLSPSFSYLFEMGENKRTVYVGMHTLKDLFTCL